MINESKISSGFDFLSNKYDFLLSITFGKSIHRSQTHFLPEISAVQSVLLVGGGTGKLLVDVLDNCPKAQIQYVDISPLMIKRSKVLV